MRSRNRDLRPGAARRASCVESRFHKQANARELKKAADVAAVHRHTRKAGELRNLDSGRYWR